MSREVVVLDDASAVAVEAARRVIGAAKRAVAGRGRFAFVLAGGSTPVALYRHLAALPAGTIPWGHTWLFWGDERCVSPDHAWSNYRMARETLLDHIPIPRENVNRMRGEDDPPAAASAYEQVIRALLGNDLPGFDLVLLGIGDDGHTASLFPGMPALSEREAAVVASGVPDYVRPQVARLTLTYPALNASRHAVFMATGASKAAAVAAALEGDDDADNVVPAACIRGPRLVTWLLDCEAASALRKEQGAGGTTR